MKEKRFSSLHNVMVRSVDNSGKKYVEGLIPYDSKSVPMFGTTEIIKKGAFNRALAGKESVLALFNHNDSHVLGNTASGTLILEDSDAGLVCRCQIPNTSYANDLYEIVSRGDIRTMSFGFYPEKWGYDSNKKERVLEDVHLDEVSFGVSFPAYPETTSETITRATRKLFKRSIDADSINTILEKETLADEDKTKITELITTLQEVLGKSEPEKPKEEQKDAERADEAAEKEELELVETAIELELLDMDELNLKIEEALKEEEEEKKE
jgi:HK97 family phage prohead protease